MSGYLEKNTLRKYKKGSIIFKENTPGNSMYIITAGSVEISTIIDDKKVKLASLGKGAMFGEMALLGDRIRSATVTAETEVMCHEINRILFKEQMGDLPNWMRVLFKVLVDRLKKTNKEHSKLNIEDVIIQILRMLVFILEKDGKEHISSHYIFWKTTINTIHSLLNITAEEVEKIMNRLTISAIASSKIGDGNARIFLVKDLDEFKKFTEFCRSKHSDSKKMTSASAFEKISPKEQELLIFISKIVRGQIDDSEIREDIFKSEFLLEFEKEISEFNTEMSRLYTLGIVKKSKKFDNEKFYVINRDNLDSRLEIGKKLETFISIENSIFRKQ